MEDSTEFKTVKRCTRPLETALKGLDSNMVDFLYQNGFIPDDNYDQIRSAKTLLSPADKAYELVKGIKNRVKQDKGSYIVLVGGLTQGGVLYQPIVNTLTEEYQRLVGQTTSTYVHVPTTIPDTQASEYMSMHMYMCTCTFRHCPKGGGGSKACQRVRVLFLRGRGIPSSGQAPPPPPPPPPPPKRVHVSKFQNYARA